MNLLRAATAMSRYDEYRVGHAKTCRFGMRRREADDVDLMARAKYRTWTD